MRDNVRNGAVPQFGPAPRPLPQMYLGFNDDSASVRAVALKAAKLAPGEKTAGELWFTRDSRAHELSLRISVGDVVFDFPFSFE